MFKAIRNSVKKDSTYRFYTDDPGATDSVEVPVEQDPEFLLIKPEPYREECFYLGSIEMFSAEIQNYGCLVEPIEYIWSRTQEAGFIRKASTTAKSLTRRLSSSRTRRGSTPFSPDEEFDSGPVKLIEIELESSTVKVRDSHTRESMIDFPMSHVATCGVHKKIPQSFAFVAVERPEASPYCHVFKGRDKVSTKQLAKQFNECFVFNLKASNSKDTRELSPV